MSPPWVGEVLRLKRAPSTEELCVLFHWIVAAMECEDEFALRTLQRRMVEVFGPLSGENPNQGELKLT
jgi:hypothetical protein